MSDGKTIFEGLYQIDWESLQPQSTEDESVINVPNALQNLLSSNEWDRSGARLRLFGTQNRRSSATLSDITPRFIPYIFELLILAETPGKEELLWSLHSLLVLHTITIANRETISFRARHVRNYVAVYQSIEDHLSLLLDFLKHHESDVRAAAAAVLGALSDRIEIILPELVAQFNVETSYDTRLSILDSLTDLLTHYPDTLERLDTLHQLFFSYLIETRLTHEMRYKVACAALALANISGLPQDEQLPFLSAIVDVLIEDFWLVYEDNPHAVPKERALNKISLLPNAEDVLWLIVHDSRLPAQDIPLLLKWLLITCFPAHYLIPNDPSKNPGYDISKKPGHRFYQHLSTLNFSTSAKTLLQKIVDDDRFWLISTNTFSFFLGLPDSRDTLRQVINTMTPGYGSPF